MSIDLDWQTLDLTLSSALVDLLNAQLAITPRPTFIGPVEVKSLDLGSAPPDVELVDLRDIYRDFLEADDDDDNERGFARESVKVSEGAPDDDAFEWVWRKAARRGRTQDSPVYHPLPPHVRYGYSSAADMFASTPALHSPRDIWNGSMSSSVPNVAHFGAQALGVLPPYPPTSPAIPQNPHPHPPFEVPEAIAPMKKPSALVLETQAQSQGSSPDMPNDDQPNLQVHLHITWHSDLRVTLTTSLLINYPSPMFMSLPIKLSVTGVLFTGEVVVAYEGQRRRVHLCILDDLDPYGPAGERPKRDSPETPPDLEDTSPSSTAPPRGSKRLPVGQRLLPNIYIESEIGQADKHVLKNVTRVEKFIQDVIRKTVEEELVFPNFHTLVMGDS